MTEDDLEALKKIGMEDWKVDCKSPVEASTTCDNQRRNGEEPERPLISAMLKAKRAVNKLETILVFEQWHLLFDYVVSA